ncbi:alpha/beta hydrolase [Streptomyces sp. NPDC048643]|uniref:alpha/beta fold hydrolase n=1 Tax=Streptomyces sp. NPDC048643 TaxID=3155637 RepID=UPI003416C637
MTEPGNERRAYHHEVRGSGPVLLVVPGGAGHPMGMEGLTDRLSERFTVVTYDPLGLSRTPVDGPVGDQRVEDWSDNAHRLLGSVLPDGESAYVFGTSSGGIVALDLLARHPERLRRVVAHEPPSVALLPDAATQVAMVEEVDRLCRREGPAVAMARLAAGLEGRPWEGAAIGRADGSAESAEAVARHGGVAPGPEAAEPAEIPADTPMAVFLAHVLRPFATRTPDVDVLKGLSDRFVLGAGRTSGGQLPRRTAVSLAGATGAALLDFPGGHLGCLEHPVEFADLLAEVLVGRATRRDARP